MSYDNAAIAEYSSLREELTALVIVRYTLLSVAITLTVTALGVVAIWQTQLKVFSEWLPSIVGALLAPTLWITRDLTRRFSRISTYMDARFERSNMGFAFQRAWREFEQQKKGAYGGYRSIVVAYIWLIACGFVLAGVAAGQLGDLGSCTQIVRYGSQVIVWAIVLGILIWQIYCARAKEEAKKEIWEGLLDKLTTGQDGNPS